MKLIKIILTCTFLFSLNLSFSQIKKTYNGEYQTGTAKYQYNENQNNERIYDGIFEFKNENIQINGFYKENLKDSIWTIKELNNGNLVSKTTLNYSLGQIEGTQISVENTIDRETKVKSIIERKITVSNKKIVGQMTSKISKNGKTTETYKFVMNKNGFLDSLVSNLKNKKTNIQTNYFNGIKVYRFVQENSTGEILNKFDIQSDTVLLRKAFQQNKCYFTNKGRAFNITNYKLEFNESVNEDDNTSSNNENNNSETCEPHKIENRNLFAYQGTSNYHYNFFDKNIDIDPIEIENGSKEIDLENKFKDELNFWFSHFESYWLSGGEENLDKGNKTEILFPISELTIN